MLKYSKITVVTKFILLRGRNWLSKTGWANSNAPSIPPLMVEIKPFVSKVIYLDATTGSKPS